MRSLRGSRRALLAIMTSATLASVGLLAPVARAATAGCPICGTNLINNPGAEAGPGTQNDSVVKVPGWKSTGGSFTVASYAWSGGDLSPTTPGPPHRGKNYFYGGPGGAVSTGTQTLSLARAASAIKVVPSRRRLLAGSAGTRARATMLPSV